MTESLCCKPETNTTLSTLLQFKINVKKKKKNIVRPNE